MCKEHSPKQFERLQGIPDVNERPASAIIAEAGADMKPFEKAANLAGRCGLKPRNDISSNKATRLRMGIDSYVRC